MDEDNNILYWIRLGALKSLIVPIIRKMLRLIKKLFVSND